MVYPRFTDICYFKKDKEFEKENECRLVIKLENDNYSEFIHDNGKMHVEFKLEHFQFLVKNIIINQKLNPCISESCVKQLLKGNGMEYTEVMPLERVLG
jgi:hypothetical protein